MFDKRLDVVQNRPNRDSFVPYVNLSNLSLITVRTFGDDDEPRVAIGDGVVWGHLSDGRVAAWSVQRNH